MGSAYCQRLVLIAFVSSDSRLIFRLRKKTAQRQPNGTFRVQFSIIENGKKKKRSTKSVETADETLFRGDILKLSMIDEYARDFVFKHGLMRPPSFMDKYSSLETLLDCASEDMH